MKNINIIFIIKRLFYSIFVLWGLSVVIFVLMRIAPGDPARMALGSRTPEEVVQRFRIAMYYDKPIYIQYYYWFKGMLHGDLGVSLVTKHPVLEDISQVFPATFELAIFAFIFIIVIGITIGIISARYNNTWVDNLGRLVAYFGIVTPSFVFAIMGMLIFCYALKILPSMGRLSPELIYPPKITGLITIDALIQGNFIVFFDAFKHLILPVVSIGLLGMAEEARITRTSVYNNMRKDYVVAAESYGIPERVIMFRDVLKPSLNPVVSILGLEFAAILAQSFLVELIFNWPGFARYGMVAIIQKDLNAIYGVVLITGIFVIFGNIIADIIVGFLDPRIYLIKERSEKIR
jgi:peptide/nickel transport system permease protein